MHSIRTKIMILTGSAIAIAMALTALLSLLAIRSVSNSSSDQILYLLCETGQKNLDFYFNSVEQSVGTVSSYAKSDLQGLDDEQLQKHVDRVRDIFAMSANETSGVLTYYYRIDPEVSDTVTGFWYTRVGGEEFQEHEVTDITLYDKDDTSHLVWFTVARANGRPVWIPPYITDNLDVRVISYNVPIYWNGTFVGVIGIEMDYTTMAEQVNNIELYDNGYAFINDDEGNIIYHPYIDVVEMTDDEKPEVPEGLISDDNLVRYSFEGYDKVAVWLPLSNGMRLNVAVPESEIHGHAMRLVFELISVFIVLIIVFSLLAMHLTRHITEPLHELTKVAEQINEGRYDIKLDYNRNDEIGILTRAFDQLTTHLEGYISDLNSIAFSDPLTHVRNKNAYKVYIDKMQHELDICEEEPEFAIGVFDCDDLKMINDRYGHDKGDVYLRNACRLICSVFLHSPVFRIGGDEFIVFLMGNDYINRYRLMYEFEKKSEEMSLAADSQWEQVHISGGIAVYNPEQDADIGEVVRRADKSMYDNKRIRKERRTEVDSV